MPRVYRSSSVTPRLFQVASSRDVDVVKMYTSFYRTLMSPTVYSEADGSYLGMDEQVHFVAPGEKYYSDMSLWDTFRTQNPWLVLTRPDVARDVAHSLVLMIEQGVNLPRWYAGVRTGRAVRGLGGGEGVRGWGGVGGRVGGRVSYKRAHPLFRCVPGRSRTCTRAACLATTPTWSSWTPTAKVTWLGV